jgi:hypothetical protein
MPVVLRFRLEMFLLGEIAHSSTVKCSPALARFGLHRCSLKVATVHTLKQLK